MSKPRRLHLRCGSDIKDALQVAKIFGDFASYGDPICEGPCPDLSGEPYLRTRADFMQRHWDLEPEKTMARFRQDEHRLQNLADYDEVLLWFEHDLFDQCILIQLLDRLPADMLEKSKLICIGAFPGVDRFVGLGQLQPEQLKALLPDAKQLTAAHQSAARLAVKAWKARDPQELIALLSDGAGPLEFLPKAIERHLQEFPCVTRGLGRTDQLILESIEQGARSALEAFAHYQASDPAPYLGDLMFWAHLRDLARSPCPLLVMDGEFPIQSLSLTKLGAAVLEGQQNYAQTMGFAKHSLYHWRGGVEQEPQRHYAWDSKIRSLCQMPCS